MRKNYDILNCIGILLFLYYYSIEIWFIVFDLKKKYFFEFFSIYYINSFLFLYIS